MFSKSVGGVHYSCSLFAVVQLQLICQPTCKVHRTNFTLNSSLNLGAEFLHCTMIQAVCYIVPLGKCRQKMAMWKTLISDDLLHYEISIFHISLPVMTRSLLGSVGEPCNITCSHCHIIRFMDFLEGLALVHLEVGTSSSGGSSLHLTQRQKMKRSHHILLHLMVHYTE